MYYGTYYVQIEWSHSLFLNKIQARQKCNLWVTYIEIWWSLNMPSWIQNWQNKFTNKHGPNRKIFSEGGKVIFPDFFPGVKCFFPVENFHFGRSKTNFSAFEKWKAKKKKKKVPSSFCNFPSFHFQFSTFLFTIFLLFFPIFPTFPFFLASLSW